MLFTSRTAAFKMWHSKNVYPLQIGIFQKALTLTKRHPTLNYFISPVCQVNHKIPLFQRLAAPAAALHHIPPPSPFSSARFSCLSRRLLLAVATARLPCPSAQSQTFIAIVISRAALTHLRRADAFSPTRGLFPLFPLATAFFGLAH